MSRKIKGIAFISGLSSFVFRLSSVVLPLASCLLLLVSFVPCLADEGDAGQAGEFLRYGVGARALGMGRAFTAVADDASAIYWNPGGLMGMERNEFTSMYSNLFYDSRFTYVALAFPRLLEEHENRLLNFLFGPESCWGAAWVNLTTADFDEREEFNQKIGNGFDLTQQAFFLSFAHEWVPFGNWGFLNAGINLKLVNDGFSGLERSVYKNVEPDWKPGVDVGVTFDPINAPIFKTFALKYLLPLRLGITAQNLLQPSIDLGTGYKEKYPRSLRWGLSYHLSLDDWRILLAYDQEHLPKREIGHYGGVEVSKPFGTSMPYLRIGANNRTGMITFGGGMRFPFAQNSAVRVDYAFGNHGDLKSDSRFFLTLEFGQIFDANYFYGRSVKTAQEKKTRKNHLHVISQYPNTRINESATALAETYDPDNAERYYRLIGGLGWANALFKEAKELLKNEKVEAAKKKAEEAIAAYAPEFRKDVSKFKDDDLLNFGEALMIAKRWEEAVGVIEEVQNPSLRYYYQLGVSDKAQGKWDVAIEDFKRAGSYERDQKSMRRLSFLGLGKALIGKGDYRSAIDNLRIILKDFTTNLDPDYPRYPIYRDNNIADDAQFMIGECYLGLGENEKALNAFAKVGRFYPSLEKARDGSAEEKIEKLVEY